MPIKNMRMPANRYEPTNFDVIPNIATDNPNITAPPMSIRPLRGKLPIELSHMVVNRAPTPPILSSTPWPSAPTLRISTAKIGINMMYAMPKKLLKKVIPIKNEKIEFL